VSCWSDTLPPSRPVTNAWRRAGESAEGPRRAPRTRWGSTAPPVLRASVIVATLAALGLALASCDRDDRNQAATVSDAWPLPSGPPATVETYVQARPWASSKAAGQAFGRIWREETRNPQDRNGRGIDAYRWAIRTCDAVRRDGQPPEAMVQRVRDGKPRFTQQGAEVIVSAALRALCPDANASPALPSVGTHR
jgi:hypothetical protein